MCKLPDGCSKGSRIVALSKDVDRSFSTKTLKAIDATQDVTSPPPDPQLRHIGGMWLPTSSRLSSVIRVEVLMSGPLSGHGGGFGIREPSQWLLRCSSGAMKRRTALQVGAGVVMLRPSAVGAPDLEIQLGVNWSRMPKDAEGGRSREGHPAN